MLMELFDYLEECPCMKAGWNSAMEKCGEQFVMTSGALPMQLLSADSLASTPQAHKPSNLPSLVRELIPSGLMTWNAQELRLD